MIHNIGNFEFAASVLTQSTQSNTVNQTIQPQGDATSRSSSTRADPGARRNFFRSLFSCFNRRNVIDSLPPHAVSTSPANSREIAQSNAEHEVVEDFNALENAVVELEKTAPDQFADKLVEITGLMDKLVESPPINFSFFENHSEQFSQILERLTSNPIQQAEDQFIELTESIADFLSKFCNEIFLPDNLLGKLAEVVASKTTSEQTRESAISLINRNVYQASDNTVDHILRQLNRITSKTKGLAELQARLTDFPKVKIPEVCHWIWHGGVPRTKMIENMIVFQEKNPKHSMILWGDNTKAIDAALSAYPGQGGRGAFQKRSAQISALRNRLSIRHHQEILTHPTIKEFLRSFDGGIETFSKLEGIVARSSEQTAVKPNYALIADIERYAVLKIEPGWYLDWNVIPTQAIHVNARAEAGIVAECHRTGGIANNAILGAHPNSPVINTILRDINNDFDKPPEVIDFPENKHPLTQEELEKKVRASLEPGFNYKNQMRKRNESLNKSNEQGKKYKWLSGSKPLESHSWELGRFSYPSETSRFRQVSRALITMHKTGPYQLAGAYSKNAKSANSIDTNLAIGHFASQAFLKPEAPGNWAKGVTKPEKSMEWA